MIVQELSPPEIQWLPGHWYQRPHLNPRWLNDGNRAALEAGPGRSRKAFLPACAGGHLLSSSCSPRVVTKAMAVNAHGGATKGWLLVTTRWAQPQQGWFIIYIKGLLLSPSPRKADHGFEEQRVSPFPAARGTTSRGRQHFLGNEFLPL